MRVISGKYRGMSLNEFKGSDIRPTADRVKVNLFNILMFKISGARVLDLFCGSGSLGIECLSRGAGFVHFNDISKESIAVANSNLKRLQEDNFAVTCADYSLCLKAQRQPFDIIFIDPPYADSCGIYALQLISQLSLLADGGIAVYERDRPFSDSIKPLAADTDIIPNLEPFDERKYGKTYLTFFKREE